MEEISAAPAAQAAQAAQATAQAAAQAQATVQAAQAAQAAAQATSAQTMVDVIYSTAMRTIVTGRLTAESVVILLMAAMAEAEKTSLPGTQKKHLVVEVLKKAAAEIPADQPDRVAVVSAILLLSPPLIDAFVSVPRRGFEMNAAEPTASCCSLC
jgi:hypothetical protein